MFIYFCIPPNITFSRLDVLSNRISPWPEFSPSSFSSLRVLTTVERKMVEMINKVLSSGHVNVNGMNLCRERSTTLVGPHGWIWINQGWKWILLQNHMPDPRREKKKKTYRARLWGKSWPTEPFSNLPTIRPGRKSFPVQSWKEGRWMIPHLDRTRKSIPTNTVYASSKTPLFLLQICTQIVLRYHSREDFQLILIKAVAYQSWRLCNSQRQFDQIGWEHLVIWWPAFGVNISHYNL